MPRSNRIFFRRQRQRLRPGEALTENPAGQRLQRADRREALLLREARRSTRRLLRVQHRKKRQIIQLLPGVHPPKVRRNGLHLLRVHHLKAHRDGAHRQRARRDTVLRPERLLRGKDRHHRLPEDGPPFRNRHAGSGSITARMTGKMRTGKTTRTGMRMMRKGSISSPL